MAPNRTSSPVPVIPDVPADASPQVRNFLGAVRQYINVREGALGDDYKALTVANASEYLDSSADAEAPAAPADLVVTKGMWVNTLTWTEPDGDYTHVEIWVCGYNSVTSAALVGVVTAPQTEYNHQVFGNELTLDHYYWIRSVNSAGLYSEWVPSPSMGGYFVRGDESIDETIDQVMDLLKGTTPDYYSAKVAYDEYDLVTWTNPTDGATRTYQRLNYAIGTPGVAPSNTRYWKRVGIIITGDVDGVPTVGIDGNQVVDGTIMARHILANTFTGSEFNASASIYLASGGELTVGPQGKVTLQEGSQLVIEGMPELTDGRIATALDKEGDLITMPASVKLPSTNPTTQGLYMNQNYIGFWGDGAWRSYIKANGTFQFFGDYNNRVLWNGAALYIRGRLVADDIKTGQLNADLIRVGTLYADRVIPGDLATSAYYYVDFAPIDSVLAQGTTLTSSNTTLIGSFTVVNPSTIPVQIVVVGNGRSGLTEASTLGSQSFGVFRGTSMMAGYGWSPSNQDNKSCSFVNTITASTSVRYDLRAAKSLSSDTLYLGMNFSVFGVRN